MILSGEWAFVEVEGAHYSNLNSVGSYVEYQEKKRK